MDLLVYNLLCCCRFCVPTFALTFWLLKLQTAVFLSSNSKSTKVLHFVFFFLVTGYREFFASAFAFSPKSFMSSAVVDILEVCLTGFLEISHLLFSLDLCCFDTTTSVRNVFQHFGWNWIWFSVFPYASGNTHIRINCDFILKQYLVILWGDTSLAFQFFEAFKLYSIYIAFSLFRKAFTYALGFFYCLILIWCASDIQ